MLTTELFIFKLSAFICEKEMLVTFFPLDIYVKNFKQLA